VFIKDKNYQSDIYLPKSNLSDIHFFIEIIEDKLILHLNKKAEPILVNTKRTTHFKNIKVGDVITADDIQFKVLRFKDEKNISKKEKLNQVVSTLEQDNPELLQIISSLSELS